MRTNSGELNVGEATIKLLEQYGLKQIQDDMKARDINLVGVDGVNPDFVMLAQSCGCHGMTIDSAVKLREAVSNAFKADRPTLIETREQTLGYSNQTVMFNSSIKNIRSSNAVSSI